MAEVEAGYGRARQYSADGPLSSSSSPQSSAVSSESPRTASSFTFSVFNLNGVQKFADNNVVAKVEEIDDDEALDSKYDIGSIDTSTVASPGTDVPRRPRGRPRKHPKPSPSPLSKPPKGRSKTGCITCRRRKKKCDERKPTCWCS
jgi:hypothetical protein